MKDEHLITLHEMIVTKSTLLKGQIVLSFAAGDACCLQEIFSKKDRKKLTIRAKLITEETTKELKKLMKEVNSSSLTIYEFFDQKGLAEKQELKKKVMKAQKTEAGK